MSIVTILFRALLFHFRDFYHDLDPVESKKWIYFEKFKMELHYQAVSKPITLYRAM